MSDKNKIKPRKCEKCGEKQHCTAKEIKDHAAKCGVRK